MKRILIVPICLLLMTSCDMNNRNAQVSELETRLDSASKSIAQRDSALTGYIDFIAAIEKNLNEIRNRESMITMNREDLTADNKEIRDNMISDLKTINKLMKENRAKIATLSVNLKGAHSQLNQLKSLVDQLKQSMDEKEKEVQKLNEQVALLTNDNQLLKNVNDSLLTDTQSQRNIIEDQNKTISSIGNKSSVAYYAAGSAKELEKKNIIEKEGGILGLGAVEQLNNNVELARLNNIDIRNTFSIPINSNKAELITSHPKDSYKMVMDTNKKKVDKLLILDPQKFWASSRCLVVVTK